MASRLVGLSVTAVIVSACASQSPADLGQIALAKPPAVEAPAQAAEAVKPVPPRSARAAVVTPTLTALPAPARIAVRPTTVAPGWTALEAEQPKPPRRSAQTPVVVQTANVATPTPVPHPARTTTAQNPAYDQTADPEQAKRFALKEAAVVAAVIAASRAAYLGTGKPCACPDNVTRNGQACGLRSAHSRPGGFKPLCYPTDVSAPVIERWRSTGAIAVGCFNPRPRVSGRQETVINDLGLGGVSIHARV